MKCVYFAHVPGRFIHEAQNTGWLLFSHHVEDPTILLFPLVQLKAVWWATGPSSDNVFSLLRKCFFNVSLYLSLIFWRVTIVWLDTDIFHFTGLGFIRVFETVQWWLYELWKTVSHYLFKYYSCPSLLSSPLEHQWVPSYLSNLSPSLLSALSLSILLCPLVLHCG